MNRPLAPGSRLASTGVYTRAGTRVVDLREVAWVDPVHLVSVAAVAEAARREGLKFRLRAPTAPQRARYAARMRLGDVENLVEVGVLRTPSDVHRLAQLVHDRVAELDGALARALHQGVAEIGENVCDHAQSVGYVAAQTIPRRGELRFAVADPGVGLQATLRGQGAESDRHAIELALAGVSRTDHGGTGVRQTVAAVTRLDGYFYLASGDAATMVTGRRASHSSGAVFAGTIVEGRVPTRRAEGARRGTMEP